MNAAWFIHGKTLRRDLRFWLAITGYDLNDRSSSNRIYLLYVIVFFSIWGLTVLALITSAVAGFFRSASPDHPITLAVQIASAVTLAWWLWSLFSSAQRSPIHFSADDAALICSTPVSRPAVVFTWLLGEWVKSGLLFWGLGITLGFIRAELSLTAEPTWVNAPLYLSNGMTFWLLTFLLHGGMFTLVWAFGSFRLWEKRELRSPVLVPVACGLLLAPGVLLGSSSGFLAALAFPVILPLAAGVGLASYLAGFLISLAWAVSGIGLLAWTSRRLNLSRAAQESIASPGLLSGGQQAASASLKRRLKSGSPPTLLPGGRGAFALVWKQVVRFSRGFSLTTLLDWLFILGLSYGIWVAPDWGSRGIALLFWILRLHDRISEELRTDLGMWFLSLALPVRSDRRLLAELGPAAVLAMLLGWAALGLASLARARAIPLELAILLPALVINLAFSAGFDVLRQTKAEHLMIGAAPSNGILAIVLSGLVVGLSGFLFNFFNGGLVGLGLSLALCAATAYGLRAFAEDSYRELGK